MPLQFLTRTTNFVIQFEKPSFVAYPRAQAIAATCENDLDLLATTLGRQAAIAAAFGPGNPITINLLNSTEWAPLLDPPPANGSRAANTGYHADGTSTVYIQPPLSVAVPDAVLRALLVMELAEVLNEQISKENASWGFPRGTSMSGSISASRTAQPLG